MLHGRIVEKPNVSGSHQLPMDRNRPYFAVGFDRVADNRKLALPGADLQVNCKRFATPDPVTATRSMNAFSAYFNTCSLVYYAGRRARGRARRWSLLSGLNAD
jgi:hypothetical protein